MEAEGRGGGEGGGGRINILESLPQMLGETVADIAFMTAQMDSLFALFLRTLNPLAVDQSHEYVSGPLRLCYTLFIDSWRFMPTTSEII